MLHLFPARALRALGLLLYSRNGEDFLMGQLNFFTETAVTPEQKVKKTFPRWEIGGRNRIFGPKTEILGPKKGAHFLILTMFWPRPEKVVQRKKVPLPK